MDAFLAGLEGNASLLVFSFEGCPVGDGGRREDALQALLEERRGRLNLVSFVVDPEAASSRSASGSGAVGLLVVHASTYCRVGFSSRAGSNAGGTSRYSVFNRSRASLVGAGGRSAEPFVPGAVDGAAEDGSPKSFIIAADDASLVSDMSAVTGLLSDDNVGDVSPDGRQLCRQPSMAEHSEGTEEQSEQDLTWRRPCPRTGGRLTRGPRRGRPRPAGGPAGAGADGAGGSPSPSPSSSRGWARPRPTTPRAAGPRAERSGATTSTLRHGSRTRRTARSWS